MTMIHLNANPNLTRLAQQVLGHHTSGRKRAKQRSRAEWSERAVYWDWAYDLSLL